MQKQQISEAKRYICLLKKYLKIKNIEIDSFELETLKQLTGKVTLKLFVASLLIGTFLPEFLLPLAQVLSILTYGALLTEIYLIIRFR